MKMLRLIRTAFSLSLRQAMAYRLNLFFDTVLAIVQLAASIGAIALVFSRTGLLAGWTAGEMLVLIGTYAVVTGLRSCFIDPSMGDFAQQIRDGRLDGCLLQPASSVLLATCCRHAPLGLLQTVLGCGVIIIGVRQLGETPSAVSILCWVLLTCTGLMIGWATTVVLASLAFWAPRLSLGMLHGAAWEFGRYPVTIYGTWLGRLLTYGFPVAAITTWPAQALTRGPELDGLIRSAGLALVFTLAAVGLWRQGVRCYTGATS